MNFGFVLATVNIMLRIAVTFSQQTQQHHHAGGPLEFGRWPREGVQRIRFQDTSVSRDQLRIEERPGNRLWLDNLSQRRPITFPDGTALAPGCQLERPLPVQLKVGKTSVIIEAATADEDEPLDPNALQTISVPLRSVEEATGQRSLLSLGIAPAPEQLAHWLETVILLQRSAADLPELFGQTAHALVELIGLDLGMVLLRQEGDWNIAAHYQADATMSLHFSRTLVHHVTSQRRTFFKDLQHWPATESLAGIEAVVVSPIFSVQDEVVGVLYGVRGRLAAVQGGIRPLEAQIVQLLAAAVGANLARLAALRTRVQFEQFFSPELVRELERNPALLDGRDQEVTVLASDLRGFTRLSERLGAQAVCRVVNDLMDVLSERIFADGGVIVDYAGDGILAMWNAPVPQPDHALHACRAALAMLDELPTLSARWHEVTGTPLQLGIGINTGPAQVGNTGSRRKLKYGPFGPTVNLASRVQDATKTLGVPLLITAATQAQLHRVIPTQLAGQLTLPGVNDPVALYEVQRDGSELP